MSRRARGGRGLVAKDNVFMRIYNLDDNSKVRKGANINDILTVRMALKPFWLFRDFADGKWCKGLFWCFIGCNYPDGIQQSGDEATYKKVLAQIESGAWAKSQRTVWGDVRKFIGVGCGPDPDAAFKAAFSDAREALEAREKDKGVEKKENEGCE